MSDTEKSKSLRDAGALVGPPGYATARCGSPNGANGTPSIRIARNSCDVEVDIPTDGLDHVRWYHAKVDWTASGRIYSVSGDGINPRVALPQRTGSASRGAGPHPGEAGGAAMVCAAAGGTEAREGGGELSPILGDGLIGQAAVVSG